MTRACSLAILLATTLTLRAAESGIEKTDLFEGGKDGYALYRIPGIVATKTGTLLAYCEARKTARGDWGTIDLWMRRSTDNGKTWEPARKIATPPADAKKNPVALAQKLAKEGEFTLNNPVAISDAKGGAVHFLYCVEYARCFYTRSDDDGKTFTKPVEITSAFEGFRPEYAWKVLATGPGHGIQLSGGRLLVPVWLSTGTGGHAHRPSVVSTIYSDDDGKTWKHGAIVAKESPETPNPSETAAVERSDGKVLMNLRNESKKQRRLVAVSPDGAGKWSEPKFDDKLPDPICFGSLVRYPGSKNAKPGILFINPDNGANRERKNVTVKLSLDDGETWAYSRSIEPGPSGYPDITVGRDGTIFCFYERGKGENDFRPRTLTVARVTLDWLKEAK
jgi:sialidase-1